MKTEEPVPLKVDIQAVNPERIAFTIAAAAEAIGRTPSYLYQEQRAGRLRFVRPNRPNADYLILVEDLKKWLEGGTVNVPSTNKRSKSETTSAA